MKGLNKSKLSCHKHRGEELMQFCSLSTRPPHVNELWVIGPRFKQAAAGQWLAIPTACSWRGGRSGVEMIN